MALLAGATAGCTYAYPTLIQFTTALVTHILFPCPWFVKYHSCVDCNYTLSVIRGLTVISNTGDNIEVSTECPLGSLSSNTTELDAFCDDDGITSEYQVQLRGQYGCSVFANAVPKSTGGVYGQFKPQLSTHVVKLTDPFGISWCNVLSMQDVTTSPNLQMNTLAPPGCVRANVTLVANNGRMYIPALRVAVPHPSEHVELSVTVASSIPIVCTSTVNTSLVVKGSTAIVSCTFGLLSASFRVTEVDFISNNATSNLSDTAINEVALTIAIDLFGVAAVYRPTSIMFTVQPDSSMYNVTYACIVYGAPQLNVTAFGNNTWLYPSADLVPVVDGKATFIWTPLEFLRQPRSAPIFLTLFSSDNKKRRKHKRCKWGFRMGVNTVSRNSRCPNVSFYWNGNGTIALDFTNVNLPYPQYQVTAVARDGASAKLLMFTGSGSNESTSNDPFTLQPSTSGNNVLTNNSVDSIGYDMNTLSVPTTQLPTLDSTNLSSKLVESTPTPRETVVVVTDSTMQYSTRLDSNGITVNNTSGVYTTASNENDVTNVTHVHTSIPVFYLTTPTPKTALSPITLGQQLPQSTTLGDTTPTDFTSLSSSITHQPVNDSSSYVTTVISDNENETTSGTQPSISSHCCNTSTNSETPPLSTTIQEDYGSNNNSEDHGQHWPPWAGGLWPPVIVPPSINFTSPSTANQTVWLLPLYGLCALVAIAMLVNACVCMYRNSHGARVQYAALA
uniref:Uncharacterized protein n=1 Tax=Otarine gammaherpesvirus 4 TaxID=2801541 RepID=A0A889IW20_9GAMA|nr:hypothetical protein [Otarine gammaherpesvirus 4]